VAVQGQTLELLRQESFAGDRLCVCVLGGGGGGRRREHLRDGDQQGKRVARREGQGEESRERGRHAREGSAVAAQGQTLELLRQESFAGKPREAIVCVGGGGGAEGWQVWRERTGASRARGQWH
jgi:hypothetical protein